MPDIVYRHQINLEITYKQIYTPLNRYSDNCGHNRNLNYGQKSNTRIRIPYTRAFTAQRNMFVYCLRFSSLNSFMKTTEKPSTLITVIYLCGVLRFVSCDQTSQLLILLAE